MKIIVLGDVCIDYNFSEHVNYSGWGSSLMYISWYCQHKLQLEPQLIARYGQDFEEYTAGHHFLTTAESMPTLVYRNYMEGEKRLQRCHNQSSAGPVKLTETINANLALVDIFVLAPLLPNFNPDYVQDVIQTLRPNCLKVLLPQGYMRHLSKSGLIEQRDMIEAEKLLPFFDLTIFSEQDHQQALPMAASWTTHSQRPIIVTRSMRGADLVTENRVQEISTSAVPEESIVDSVGCGDVFSAATLCHYYQHRNLVQAIQIGNKAARSKLFQSNPAVPTV